MFSSIWSGIKKVGSKLKNAFQWIKKRALRVYSDEYLHQTNLFDRQDDENLFKALTDSHLLVILVSKWALRNLERICA
jgi:hypothetical protein